MRIAIIEDNEPMRQILVTIVKSIDNGIIIDEFESGSEFLHQMQLRDVMNCEGDVPRGWDCAILDVLLPGATGLEIGENIKSGDDYPNIPLMFVTGMSDQSSIGQFEEYGLILTKPYSIRTAKYILRKWFDDVLDNSDKIL
jgi:DNA-binding response OmpR family regulator